MFDFTINFNRVSFVLHKRDCYNESNRLTPITRSSLKTSEKLGHPLLR